MAQIICWKSEDGKIFEDKSKYQTHLRKLATHRRAQRKLKIESDAADAVWAELYEREQSIEQWAQMVIDNQHLFWAEAARGEPGDWDRVGKKFERSKKASVMPAPRLLEFTKLDLYWDDCVSNSHSCPHDGVTNWGGRTAGAPRGYPGFTGNIEWMCEWPLEFAGIHLASDLFACGTFRSGRQRAHTGTGGYRGAGYSEKHGCETRSSGFDFRLYAADWPGLARYYEKRKMWKTLGGRQLDFA
ncbi:hypothetical protein [Flavobacterium sp.]|jgi:hypothetical protein|uniref:hypothetical protein n=1 Tax=Flavobacterium sp. TaxID=239 RepID=UPI0037C157B2